MNDMNERILTAKTTGRTLRMIVQRQDFQMATTKAFDSVAVVSVVPLYHPLESCLYPVDFLYSITVMKFSRTTPLELVAIDGAFSNLVTSPPPLPSMVFCVAVMFCIRAKSNCLGVA